MTFSIIICFYNASKKLHMTLQHIKQLDISSVSACELILVNNNSTDNSIDIITKELKDFNSFPWKIIFESTPGVSYARLKGISEAHNDIIVFCDDDNWLASDYLTIATRILQKNSNIAAIGGYGVAVSEIPIPDWFNEYQNFYAVGEQMPSTGIVKGVRNMVYGAGMVLRKSAWDYIASKGFVFSTAGRVAGKLSSGEDSEICLAIQIAGYKIWYEESLRFQHYIKPYRLTKKYLNNLKNGIESSSYISRFYRDYLFGYKPHVTKYFWLKELLYSVKDLVQGLFINPTKKGMKRNFDFSLYLLRERGRYNENVRKVLKICENLSKKVAK